MTQQYHFASMDAWLSSTGISHHNLLPNILLICLSTVNSSFTIPKLQLPVAAPSRGPVSLSRERMAVERTVCFSFHLGCHRSAVSLSALNISPLTHTIALMWNQTPASAPLPAEGRSSPINTPVLPSNSFILQSLGSEK